MFNRMPLRCSILLLSMVLSAPGWAAEKAQQKDAASGRAWVTPAMKAPGVTHHVFRSAAVKGDVSYHLYRPTAYEAEPAKRFPVVYWLHGSGGGLPGIASVAARKRSVCLKASRAEP